MVQAGNRETPINARSGYNLRKQILFISIAMLIGITTACLIIAILGAIAVPVFDSHLLTIAEHNDFKRMQAIFGPVAESPEPLLVLALLIVLSALTLLLAALNPNFRFGKMRDPKAAAKGAVILFAALGLTVLSAFLEEIGAGGILIRFVYLPLASGALWLLAGESGWAGDLSSWSFQPAKSDPGRLATILMGVLWGLTAGLLAMFGSQIFQKFYIVVSEVLDGTGETSYAGFIWFLAGVAFLVALGSGIIIGLAFSFAPAVVDREERSRMLLVPGILTAVLFMVSAGGYLYAVGSYDLGTETLSKAAGLSYDDPKIMTVANLSAKGTSDGKAWEWPLEAETWGFAYNDTIMVSPGNLERLDRFLAEKRGRSVFQYNGMDARLRSSFALFDLDGIEELIADYSGDLLIARMTQVYRLRFLPVTEANRHILESYTDENRWHIPGKPALLLARAFDHFGMVEKAEYWFQRAMDDGQEPEDFQPSEEPALIEGNISGRVEIAGLDLSGVTLGLMSTMRILDEKLTLMDLQMDLLATTHPDADGSFAFSNLGSGKYRILALLPEQIDPSSVVIEGDTGLIELDTENPVVEVGTIAISY